MKAYVNISGVQNDGTNLNISVDIQNLVSAGDISGTIPVLLTMNTTQAVTALENGVVTLCAAASLTLTTNDIIIFGGIT